MKKRKVVVLFFILALLLVALTACGLFGGEKEKKPNLTADMIFSTFVGQTYLYTGNPIVIDLDDLDVRVDGRYVPYDQFELEVRDNVEAGTASVRITAKSTNQSVKGSVVVHFFIEANGSIPLGSEDDLNALLAKESVSGLMLDSDYEIPEGVTVTIPEGKTLTMIYGYTMRNRGTILNYGNVVMRGAKLSTGNRRDSVLVNYGTLENHGDFEIRECVTIYDLGTFTSEKEIESSGNIYLLEEDKSFLKDGAGGQRFIRKAITAEDLEIEECTYIKNIAYYAPRVTLKNRAKDAFTTEYANNDRAGVGSVTVTINEFSPTFYGSVTTEFTIKKGVVNFAGEEELLSLCETQNFEEYKSDSLSLGVGTLLALRKGEKLTLASGLTVDGRLESAGIISCSKVTVSEGGSFFNDGLLTVNGSYFDVYGECECGAQGDYSFENSVRVYSGGTFLNRADFAEPRSFLLYGTLKNHGNLSLTNTYLGGRVENYGTLLFSNGFSASGDVVNAAGAEMRLEKDGKFSKSLQNAGKITNVGRVAFADGCTYSGAGVFDNEQGQAWAFAAIPAIGKNFYLRRYLTEESVNFGVEYDSIYYDAHNHVPAFTVDGATLSKDECHSYCRYLDREKAYTEFVLTGRIQMTVSIYVDYSIYAGSITHVYEILPATVHISDSSKFSEYCEDPGYERVVLDADVELSRYRTYYVTTGSTLDLNGHRLIVSGKYFYNYGTICGGAALPQDFVPSVEGASVVVKEDAFFANYGTLVNDGLFYVEGKGYFNGNAKRDGNATRGTVENNGVIFTNDDNLLTCTGEGVVHTRVKMGTLRSAITVAPVTYDGEQKTPTPVLTYREQAVDVSRFDLSYALNVEASEGALVTLKVNDPFDPDFYDLITTQFTILRGSIVVSNRAEFLLAAQNVNYQTIRLSADLTLNAATTLSDGQTVDLGAHELSFSGEGSLTYGKDCRLVLTAGDETRLLKYLYGADEITLTADIGVAGAQTVMDFSAMDIPNVVGENFGGTIIHTDGYDFPGGISYGNYTDFQKVFTLTIQNDSEEESVLGTAEYLHEGLRYSTCNHETVLAVKGLKIYGCYMQGGTGAPRNVEFRAENCVFLGDLTDQYAEAFSGSSGGICINAYFTDCSFDGYTAVTVYRGNFTFTRCSLHAHGAYNAKKYVGNALLMDRVKSIQMTLDACSLTSDDGYAVEITSFYSSDSFLFPDTTFTSAPGKSAVYNHPQS